MPRCQRTFKRLGDGVLLAGVGILQWICPHCIDKERYETVRQSDLFDYAEWAKTVGCQDFGIPSDADWRVRLLRGLSPECVREPDERLYDLYISTDADPWQSRLQIGHEIFHRLCSQGHIFHWTHEMLACLFSIRLLRRMGADAYADTVHTDYLRDAEHLSLKAMCETDLWKTARYPEGLYGRAYLTGEILQNIVGWESLCRLAFANRDSRSEPNIADWLESLPTEKAKAAAAYLQVGVEPCGRENGGTFS